MKAKELIEILKGHEEAELTIDDDLFGLNPIKAVRFEKYNGEGYIVFYEESDWEEDEEEEDEEDE